MATGNARKRERDRSDESPRVESAEIATIRGYTDAGAITSANDAAADLSTTGGADLPLASEELAAALRETGAAVNIIIDQAERILDCNEKGRTYRATVQSAMLRILEVCAFEDLAGQRINKVAQVLENMEQTRRSTDAGHEQTWSRRPIAPTANEAGLDGPALNAPHMSQADINAIFSD